MKQNDFPHSCLASPPPTSITVGLLLGWKETKSIKTERDQERGIKEELWKRKEGMLP